MEEPLEDMTEDMMALRIDVNRSESVGYCQYFFEIFWLKIIE